MDWWVGVDQDGIIQATFTTDPFPADAASSVMMDGTLGAYFLTAPTPDPSVGDPIANYV